jgi:hypothetical protein
LTIAINKNKEINVFREMLGAVPRQLEELRIQGQASEDDGGEVLPEGWLDGFAQGTILPRLRALTFTYGFDDEKKEAEGEAVDETALRVETMVEEAARKRGIAFSRESIRHPR